MNKTTKQLSPEELEKLKEVLSKFEQDTKRDTGVINISGGYAIAEMFNYDDQWIDVELKWGVQNDVENRPHSENYKINRKTWEIQDA